MASETRMNDKLEALIDKTWADFINCRSDRYFGNRSKLDKQKDVLRRFAGQVQASGEPRHD